MKQLDKYLYGPWALVTGASSGIGEEFARHAAANGINVVLVARREERLKEVAAELTARYDIQARAVAVDLGRDGFLDRVTEATDDLDIGLLVSNAGAGNPGPFISLPRERLREIVQLNVITHLLSQIPYRAPKRPKVRLPDRKVTSRESSIELPFIPTPF